MSAEVKSVRNLFLALNLGNTNLGCALFQGRELLSPVPVPVGDIPDDSRAWDRFIPAGMLDRVGLVVMASVNPPAAQVVCRSLGKRLDQPVLLLGPDHPIPVVARVEEPARVGADRLLNVLAAFDRVHGPAFVVDFGTAITIDVCSVKGEYLGGVIAPGLRTAAQALHRGTALLPEVVIEPPATVTGRNTTDCIRSGVFWGTAALVEGLVERLRAEHPQAGKVLATGGDAQIIAPHIRVIDAVVPDLTMQGVRLAARASGLLR